jgi:GNAT superfamily N-acetyltransferase
MEDDTLDAVAAAQTQTLDLWRRDPEAMCAFAAIHEGVVLGIVTLTRAFAIYAGGWFGIVSELYVVPAARSTGIGAELLAEARRYGESRGWTRLELTAGDATASDRRLQFYERNGFLRVGVRLKVPLTTSRNA